MGFLWPTGCALGRSGEGGISSPVGCLWWVWVRVGLVYVPNGREPDSEHYRYKLVWLTALREMIDAGPSEVIVAGDMNIAPTDEDVFDPDTYIGQTHVTGPTAAPAELQVVGLHDVVRERSPTQGVFTYRDCRAGISTRTLACASTWCWPALRSPSG